MPLKSANLLPHSPLLVPEIGRANHAFFEKTSQSFTKTAEKLLAREIDTIIIISSHAEISADYFCLNVAPEMAVDLKDFGFIPPKTALPGASILADKINLELGATFPIQMASETSLDHGSSIPAYLFKNLGLSPKILVISPASGLDAETIFSFGSSLGKIIGENEKNIAVIASGDLSHRLKKKSPGGYSPKGARYDSRIIEGLREKGKAAENLLKIDKKLIEAAGECAYKPLILLLGLLNGIDFEVEIMAYQTDFGVGYLSADFKID
jgi:MEMO1 family protein